MRYLIAGLAACLILLTGCTDELRATETLRKSGFTEIRTTGFELWGCSDDDVFQTGFRAKNVQGQQVNGVVCCGLMKSCTVRF
jgi:hypothetical protein